MPSDFIPPPGAIAPSQALNSNDSQPWTQSSLVQLLGRPDYKSRHTSIFLKMSAFVGFCRLLYAFCMGNVGICSRIAFLASPNLVLHVGFCRLHPFNRRGTQKRFNFHLHATKAHQNPPPRAHSKIGGFWWVPVWCGGFWWVLVGKCPKNREKCPPILFLHPGHIQSGTKRNVFVPKWNALSFQPFSELSTLRAATQPIGKPGGGIGFGK